MNTYVAMYEEVVNKYRPKYGPYIADHKLKTGMREVSLFGRAGEGVWLSGELLAAALIGKGKFCKVVFTMPSERRNTLTRSFLRFADVPVRFPVAWIHNADDMLVMEEELLRFNSPILDFEMPVVMQRMNPEGFCVVNSPKAPRDIEGDIAGKLVTVDATKISVEYLGNPFFMNIAVVGAYLAAKNVVELNEMEKAIRGFVNPRGHRIFEGEKGDMNIKALRAGYESVRV
jgi:2-oxoacid:acceptor oxidoreductase gamma subunit (pyruvate/2-ketoisovalerate family)